MKKTVTLLVPAALLLLGSCASEQGPAVGQGEGLIALHVAADGNVTDAVPLTRASQATFVPEASDLALKLTKSDGSYSKSWDKVSDFPSDQPFSVGSYVMQASWGNPDDEGFEKPYYYGEEQITVEEGAAKEVNLTASLANCMVSISYTEAFRNYFTQYSSQLHSEGGDFITFLSDEERPAYLRPGNINLTLSITKANGVSANIQPAEFQAVARHHYHIILDVNNGATGEAELAVKFDDSVVSEDVTVDLSDDVLSAPEPVVIPAGFTPGETLTVQEFNSPSTPTVMTVTAPGGLRSVTLTIQSPALNSKGFPAEIDLLAANASQQALLQTLGVQTKGLWKNPDKMAVIDLTDVFKQIEGAGDHSFALVVKDKLGKVNLPVILEAKSTAAGLALKSAPSVAVNADRATITIESDAEDIASALQVETYNFGAWSEARILSAAPAASARHRAPGVNKDYNVTFAIPEDAADQQVRVKYHGQVKASGSIPKHGAILTLEGENYVFATKATFKVTCNPKVGASALKYFIGKGDGTYTPATVSVDATNSRVTFTNLTPGAIGGAGVKYYAVADENSAESALAVCSFTTEPREKLYNGDMELWTTAGSSGSNWSTAYCGEDANSVWGTNNPMTTSEGGNYAYVRISGTIGVTDAHGGTGMAARISTQGWGSGNTAIGNIGSAAVCHYIDAGLLHLGANRSVRPSGVTGVTGPLNTDDLNCGMPINSRPSKVTFWYKYSPKNSDDCGHALVQIFDKSGKLIVQDQMELTKADAYTKKELLLNYPAGAPQAGKIYVRFMSTDKPDALTKNSAWMNAPPFGGNWGKGEYSGSRLFIDDVEFNY